MNMIWIHHRYYIITDTQVASNVRQLINYGL